MQQKRMSRRSLRGKRLLFPCCVEDRETEVRATAHIKKCSRRRARRPLACARAVACRGKYEVPRRHCRGLEPARSGMTKKAVSNSGDRIRCRIRAGHGYREGREGRG